MPRDVDTRTLATGTATAQPLKFVSGTLLTTAAVGSVEFLNGTFYVTDGLGRRELRGVWLGTAIDDTPQVILAAATVTRIVTVQYAVGEETGTGADGGTITLAMDTHMNIYNDGTGIVRLTLSAGGELSIARTAGADTFSARLWTVWI